MDPLTPIEETLSALDDAQRAGKIIYTGVSNLPAWTIAKFNGIATQMGVRPFASTQNYYSLAGRDLEYDILPFANSEKVAVLPWSPLAGGFISGKFRKAQTSPEDSRRAKFDFPPVNLEKAYQIVDVLESIANELECTIAQVALAAIMVQKGVTSTIIGVKTTEQLIENLKSSEVKTKLTADHLAQIDAVSKPETIYPYWMMERQIQGRSPAN
ncbi:MAG: putative oxidoreductase [candidate division WS2 bacterium]|uniref:Oxidoreductase n=1 Tax=Psychracetigena formicireducens TaxID=2986056 RepID=A0A9E2BI53_PSYF1|nr:putative oxidoreductase [Candidatus Psychracetigena formicireducens]